MLAATASRELPTWLVRAVRFLDRGRIVEEGNHDELLRRGGRYAEFWAMGVAPVAVRE